MHPGHTETYGHEVLDWRSWCAFTTSLGDPALSTVSLPNQNRRIGHTTPSTAAFICPDSTLITNHPRLAVPARLARPMGVRREPVRPTADAYNGRLERSGDRNLPSWDLRVQLSTVRLTTCCRIPIHYADHGLSNPQPRSVRPL